MIASAEIVFVRLVVPLLIGICCFYNLEQPFYVALTASLSILTLAILLVFNIGYKQLAIYRLKYLTGCLFTLLYFFFGGWICLLHKDTLHSAYFGNKPYTQLKVWVADEPQIGNGTLRFTANVTASYFDQKVNQAIGKVVITIKTDSLQSFTYHYGDELLLSTNCAPVSPPFNPGEFDFKAWLALKNVYHQAFVPYNKVIKTGNNKGNPLLKFALELRKSQIEVYKRIIKDKEAFAVASTLILGYRADLSSETLTAYSKTGTVHALSVSGMHVGIIYMVLNWLLSFLDKKRKLRIAKVVLICTLIWFYSLLTGFSPSILRSAIMLTIYILAKSFNKHTNAYNILAFTAFCMLIYNPFLIWDVGFQLSFLAVFGLIYLHPKIYKWLYFKPRWADWLWSSIALSIAAQVTTFPLSIYYFHQFPLYFIISNLFILIPIIILMYLGISILIIKLYVLAPLFEGLIIFMNNGLKWIASLPFAGINQIWITKIQLILLSLGLILGLIALSNYKKQLLIITVTIFLILELSLAKDAISIKHQKKIIFFSTPKDYATAFIYAQNAIVISNLNIKDRNFQFHIQPALDQLRINRIQFIKWGLVTHLNFFNKNHHQINFNGYRILLLDNYFNYKIITKKPIFNAIWIHDNPKFQMQELRKSVIFNALTLDASNYTSTIKKFSNEAKKFQYELHVLKKNKAYLVDLNKLPQ